ncbi:MAG: hypothetical protein PHV18_12390 [Lachnospiraceae bacterium]|nr:hypothetical protein [Lachnospiraceae bacterium]
MGAAKWKERVDQSDMILIGLGEEWKLNRVDQRMQLLEAYRAMYELIKDKDYFIITLATDALIYETNLGSQSETVARAEMDAAAKTAMSCGDRGGHSDPGDHEGAGTTADAALAAMDHLFPVKEIPLDTRWQRIVAPCGNETWKQCSLGCTKDIWESGELPEEICPHCGAPLTGNTIEASPYIEEGYLPQWNRYTRWLTKTLNRKLLILELGVGFAKPGVIRFPFEKTAFFNQKSFLCRVNEKFPQITEELTGRAEGIAENSVEWVLQNSAEGIHKN